MDALSLPKPILSVRHRRRREAAPLDPLASLDQARRLAYQLPVLRQGFAVRRIPEGWDAVVLRLDAALWEVAAAHDVQVTAGTSRDDLARLLAARGVIVPPAEGAVRALTAVLAAAAAGDLVDPGDLAADAARVAARVVGYLELRARFG